MSTRSNVHITAGRQEQLTLKATLGRCMFYLKGEDHDTNLEGLLQNNYLGHR